MDNLDLVELPSNVLPTVSGKRAVICMTADGKLYCVTASGAKRLMTVDEACTVGTVLCRADARSPAEFIGGTWEKIAQGRMIIGASDTYPLGSMGGSSDAVVVEHNHQQAASNGNHGYKSYYRELDGNSFTVLDSCIAPLGEYFATITGQYLPLNTIPSGVNGVGKNMPPYFAQNIWERIA